MENYPLRLLTFLEIELNQYVRSFNIPYSTPLSRYLNRYNIVEVYLDNILKSGDDSKLPFEVTIARPIDSYLIIIETIYFRFLAALILKLCLSNTIICVKYHVPSVVWEISKFSYSLKTC